MDIRKCIFDNDTELQQLVDLQNEVYQKRGLHFTKDIFRYWYLENPEGKVISYNAFDQGRLVAHQSFVPERMLVEGQITKCVRSMAVVTHSDYRGKGLLSQLTNAALEDVKNEGYAFAYAVTNGNSVSSFVNHCGFSFVTRLRVKMGFGKGLTEDGGKTYRRFWSKDSLNWRLRNGKYVRSDEVIIGKFKLGVNTIMGMMDPSLVDATEYKDRKIPCGINLYVGLGAKLPWSYWDVPKFIKHSPFNLVFRDLTGGTLPAMTKDNVFYQLIDFDVA
jgi:GNAT superfamily N-acetyltransferase